MTKTLAELTPREVDEKLANLHGTLGSRLLSMGSVINTAHRLVGDKSHYVGRNKVWNMERSEVIIALQDMVFDNPYQQTNQESTLKDIWIYASEIAVLQDQIWELNTEYNRRPWSRFFLVLNSNGHIHKDMSCHTCTFKTKYGWLPELSGKTEADAVVEKGTILCSVCFPTAPVEWTIGKVVDRSNECPGSKKSASMSPKRGFKSCMCPDCGKWVAVTGAYAIRSHKKKS